MFLYFDSVHACYKFEYFRTFLTYISHSQNIDPGISVIKLVTLLMQLATVKLYGDLISRISHIFENPRKLDPPKIAKQFNYCEKNHQLGKKDASESFKATDCENMSSKITLVLQYFVDLMNQYFQEKSDIVKLLLKFLHNLQLGHFRIFT